jgi:predicted nucleotidyltransferase
MSNRSKKPREADLALAKRCAQVIRALYPDAEVILYGSRARGTPEADSDMDLLVLTKEQLTWREEEKIIEALYPLELETGMVISPKVEREVTWQTPRYQIMPLAAGIRKDGVPL